MKNELKENNALFYETAKETTFSQVPMSPQELKVFQRTTIRRAKGMRYVLTAFFLCSFGVLIYYFLKCFTVPVSYICAGISFAIMCAGVYSTLSSAKEDKALLEIYEFPDERKGLKTVDIESSRITVSHANMDNVVYNNLLIDGGTFLIESCAPPAQVINMLQEYSMLRIFFYEADKNHRLKAIQLQPV